MSDDTRKEAHLNRRNFLAISTAFGSSLALSRPAAVFADSMNDSRASANEIEPFFGPHQAGIVSPQQSHTYFASLDLTTAKRTDLIAVLQEWTEAAELMSRGLPVQTVTDSYYPDRTIPDSGEAIGLSPKRLTITIGFGPGVFIKDGSDRFGLAHKRPAELVELPKFSGEQLIEARTGGDLSIQACADDPMVAFHAVRQLIRMASGIAQVRWVQSGFLSGDLSKGTPRNLMGFKDGTQTPTDLDAYVWSGREGPRWMHGGSYMITRRIRIALEHWDQMNIGFQEQVVGRKKSSGAPLGMDHEFDALPLQTNDKDGNPLIADNAHVRLANASTNNGAQILRRGYSYNEGVSFIAERWPPWRQAMEYDAGLLFISYQRDPRTSFIPMLEKMSKVDMLNQFTTHTGSGIFACPGGVARGEYIGQHLFERA